MWGEVAEWLNSQDDVTNVHPVQVWLHDFGWQGATFIRNGEQVYYLLGERPTHRDPTCYLLQSFDSDDLDPYEWYIGGYFHGNPNERTQANPFGNHWLLVPWIIEDDPESKIDDYTESYERTTLSVKEF
jgi:hypothetical protein